MFSEMIKYTMVLITDIVTVIVLKRKLELKSTVVLEKLINSHETTTNE